MDKNIEYEIILEALHGLRTLTKREMAVAYYDGERVRHDELVERMRKIDDTIDSVRKKLNKLLLYGG